MLAQAAYDGAPSRAMAVEDLPLPVPGHVFIRGNPNNPDSFPVHGVAQKLDRFRCGNDDVVLFERPKPIQRDALDEDGIFHQAFDMAWEDYDDALKTAKELGRFHRGVERDSGNTIYMFDSEGNYLELHFPRPGGRRQRQAN